MDLLVNAISVSISFVLHIDTHLGEIIAAYGTLSQAILFGIVFVETGLVVMPLLPGDSLLFAAGAFASKGAFDIKLLIPLLILAAVGGDAMNYAIGKYVGPKVFRGESRFFKKEYLLRTQEFYKKYGKKTIFLARFVPIIRTFAPFVAGVGEMPYRTFAMYNVIGGIVWVTLFVLLGYYFGSIPAVEENFSLVILGIIIISILPMVYEFIRARMTSDK